MLKLGKDRIIFSGSLIAFLFLIFYGCNVGKTKISVKRFYQEGEVPRKTNFTIVFSDNVVLPESVDVWKAQKGVRITPTVEGRCKWINQKELRFYPEEQLKPSTEYKFEILPILLNNKELHLKGKRNFEFHTERIIVKDFGHEYVIDEKEPNSARIRISFEFNYVVESTELKKYLQVRFEKGEPIKFETEQKKSANILSVISTALPIEDIDRKVRMLLDSDLLPVHGELGLVKNYEATFSIPARSKLVVESSYPECSSSGNWITVKLSTFVNTDVVKNYIEIDPPISFYLLKEQKYVYIHAKFVPGKEYVLKLKKGLPALNGNRLENEFSGKYVMNELEPSIDFVTRGIFLPSEGNLKVGIETVNMDTIELSVEKVFINNLVYFLNNNQMYSSYFSRDYLGKHIAREKIRTEKKRNTKVTTTVDMNKYLAADKKGIYILILNQPEHYWDRKIKWVKVTDIGIIAKVSDDEMVVFVNSLESLQPVEGVKITLQSRSNQVLFYGETNSEGVVRFKNYRQGVEGFEPFVITAEKYEDVSFLKLRDSRLSLTDFDISGASPMKEGYEAFVYTDRGVYRPGDTVHLAVATRDDKQLTAPNFPLKLRILAPDGKIFNEYRGWVGEAGLEDFDIDVPIYAMTGVYRAMVIMADSTIIGRLAFNVEEFMPQRIKVNLEVGKDSYIGGEDVNFDIAGTMLFGPPAAGRKVRVVCEIRKKGFHPSAYSKFNFSDYEKHFDQINLDLGENTLDNEGKFSDNFRIPDSMKAPSSLEGLLKVSVLEMGGRAVTKYSAFTIHPYPFYIGMRRQQEGYAKKDEGVHIDYVVLKPDGKKAQTTVLEFSYYKVEWNTILERDNYGTFRYVSEKSLNLVEKRKVTYAGDISSVSFVPHHYGQYKAVIRDPASDVSSSIDFYVSGWGYAPWAMSEPEKLKIDFDKESYKVGERATLQIRAPFPGRLVLTIERDRVLDQKVIEMKGNTAKITIPVLKDYKPNVYVVGHLIRSNKSADVHAPKRAYGAYPLLVDCRDNKLAVDVKVPSHIKPISTLDVSVSVEGGAGRTYLTIAAVDEGICQITSFDTPDPFGYFYRKRRLSVETFDIYSFILPELEKVGLEPSVGGGRAGEAARHLMPVALRRVKPVALWSGVVKTNNRGKAIVHFDVPQFQGSLRIMVVAFNGSKFGSSFKNVTVSDPIVLTPTFPRFLTGKDSFDIPVNVYNSTKNNGKVTVELIAKGAVRILSPKKRTINIASKKEELVKFTCQAGNEIGALHFNLKAKGLSTQTNYDVDIPLRPGSPMITKVGAGKIGDNGEVSLNISPDWIEGTTRFHLSVSTFPAIKFGHSLRFLLRYPYGCIEQTTSRVFPLLYFSDIAKVVDPSLFQERSSDYYVKEGIDKLKSMQMADGAFSYWPGGHYESEWGSIYATHFLTEARKAGYEIPDWVLVRAANHLKVMLKKESRAGAEYYRLNRQAYIVYVLSLLGKPDKVTMNYLKEVEYKKMSTWAQVLLAGAYAYSGDVNTAMSMIPFEIAPSESPRETGDNFNSGTRENAIILDVLSEVDPDNASIPVLIEALAKKLKDYRYYSTQESAFGFVALGKSLRNSKKGNYTGKVWMNIELLGSFDTESKAFNTKGAEGKKVKIGIKGAGPCYYYWYISGIKKGADFEEYSRGLRVNRVYFDEWGNPLVSGSIEQGDIIIARLTMTALTDNLDNVIVSDMLPAGLEIENPRLQSRQTIDWIEGRPVVPDYMDIRDDRLNIFLNLRKGKKTEFYYMLRAVTSGRFILPPVSGEAMYDPFKSSVENSGVVFVKPAK